MPRQAITEKSLTIGTKETAQMLGISDFLVRKLIDTGELPSIRLGRIIRVPRSRLLKMIDGDDVSKPEEAPQD